MRDLTLGEQYALFLLLLPDRSLVRQVLEGTHKADGSVVIGGKPARDADELNNWTIAALVAFGFRGSNGTLGGKLWADSESGKVTRVAKDIATAIGLNYGGSCPKAAEVGAIITGLRGTLG